MSRSNRARQPGRLRSGTMTLEPTTTVALDRRLAQEQSICRAALRRRGAGPRRRARLVRRGRHRDRAVRRRARHGRHAVPHRLDHQDVRGRRGAAAARRGRARPVRPGRRPPAGDGSERLRARHRRPAAVAQLGPAGRDERPVVGAHRGRRLGRPARQPPAAAGSVPAPGSTTPTSATPSSASSSDACAGCRGTRPSARACSTPSVWRGPPCARRPRARRGGRVHPLADLVHVEPEHHAGAMAPAGQLWSTVGGPLPVGHLPRR